MHKIEIYQRIAAVQNNQQLEEIAGELADRFGQPPQPVKNLLTVARIRNYARDMGVEKILQAPLFLEIHFRDTPHIRPEGMVELSGWLKSYLKVIQDRNLIRISVKALAKKRVQDFVLRLVQTLAG